MNENKRDLWTEWLLNKRFGGKAELLKTLLELFLYPVRDKVLFNAKLGEEETLIDIGCGDGLISFGALEKSDTIKVIFSDISQDILNHDREIAEKMNVLNRSSFICASADDLSIIDDNSVDIITVRSVLIYVEAKQKAFNEFYRILKPGGRISIFEPINRFSSVDPVNSFWGYNVEPVADIAEKVKAVFHRIQQPDSDPMLNFDERDLITFADNAGFEEVHLDLHTELKRKNEYASWEILLKTAFHPKFPTLEEVMQEALTPSEKEKFVKILFPLVEARQGIMLSSVTYLWGIK